MARYDDPQEVHGCECHVCGNYQADNETDVDDRGVCWDCVEEEEPDEDDAPPPSTDWFSVACGIVL